MSSRAAEQLLEDIGARLFMPGAPLSEVLDYVGNRVQHDPRMRADLLVALRASPSADWVARPFAALLAPPLANGAAIGEAQLLPAGEFSARDGRPGPGKRWRLNDAQGERLAAQVNTIAHATPLVIDYEHQTLNSRENGRAAPAAGWIRSVQWRRGEGLFASVEWTATAKTLISAGEYRYISPVIIFDEDGTVTDLRMAGLVNHPALIGLAPVNV